MSIDILAASIPIGLAAAVSTTSYLIHKVVDTEKQLAAHVASDLVTFQFFAKSFEDLKNEQRDQTQKLDRLVEKLID